MTALRSPTTEKLCDSGRIYSLDVSKPMRLEGITPKLWLEIAGANSLMLGGGEMFIATIPADYRTVTADNVIYRVRNLKKAAQTVMNAHNGVFRIIWCI